MNVGERCNITILGRIPVARDRHALRYVHTYVSMCVWHSMREKCYQRVKRA